MRPERKRGTMQKDLAPAPADSCRPRVLITVSGGVADFVCDPGVEVAIFDHDNHGADPDGTAGVPAHFADLAAPLGIPIEDAAPSATPGP